MKNLQKNNILALWDEPSLRQYLGEVKRRHGYVETVALPNMRDISPARIESIFVQPLLSAKKLPTNISSDEWQEGESLLEALQRDRRVVLLGDPGSGKTTLSNWLAWRLSAGLIESLPPGLEDFLPIPCILREIKSSLLLGAVSITDLAIEVAQRLLAERFSFEVENQIRLRVEQGKFVLILDGIDEIPISHRRNVANWIQQTSELNGYVLGTSRIVGYDDWPVNSPPKILNRLENGGNVKKADIYALQIEKHENLEPHSAWAVIRYLMPFDQKRISAFIFNWYLQRTTNEADARVKTDDLVLALNKSEPMQRLARIPNLLSLIAIVHRERTNLPDGKALLYKEISNAYLNTIDQHRKIAGNNSFAQFNWEARESWLAYVGFQMQLERSVEKELSEHSDILVEKEVILRWLSEAMRESYVDDPQALSQEFLEWIARRSGLLIPRGENLYAFSHLSFQEYFCARYIAGRVMSRAFIRNKQGPDAKVTPALIQEWSENSLWHEIFVFFFEIISSQNENDWIEEFVDLIFGEPDELDDFDQPHAKLAARILADQYIRFSPARRDWLAARSSREAFDEWRFFSPQSNRSVFKDLFDSEYITAYIAYRDSKSKKTGELSDEKSIEAITHPKSTIFVAYGKNFDKFDIVPGLEKLRYISARDTAVTDLEPLKSARSLLSLQILNSPVTDASALASLKQLKDLDIGQTNVKDISFLHSCKNVIALNLDGCPVLDFQPLKKLKLDVLSLLGCKIKDLSVISEMRGLLFLDLDQTRVDDISPISGLKELGGLCLSNTPIKDLTPLGSLPRLQTLHLQGCRAKNPEIVGRLKNLTFLNFGTVQKTDLSFLKNLKKLQTLQLCGKNIDDLSIIKFLPKLKQLRLINTGVENFSIISSNPNIQEVTIDDKVINDVSKENLLKFDRVERVNS